MSNIEVFAEAMLLRQSALITLYELDLSAQGAGILRFYPGVDNTSHEILWQGAVFTAFPVEARGFEIKSQGQLPRPDIVFANVFGYFSSLCLQYNDLVGCKLSRKRTFEKFLDGKPDADPTACFPDDVYYIDRKKEENKQQVSFELASPMDVDDVAIPRRKIISNLCQWIYRSTECSFALDTVVADVLNVPFPDVPLKVSRGAYSAGNTYHVGDYTYITTNSGIRRYFYCKADNAGAGIINVPPPNTAFWTGDECSKMIKGCMLRFRGRDGGLPMGAFPATGRLPF